MQGLDRLIDYLINIIHRFQFWKVIPVYGRAVVLRLGHFNREIGPGFHFVLPLGIEQVYWDNSVPAPIDTGAQSLTTQDGHTIVIGVVLMWEIADIQALMLQVEGRESVLGATVHGVVSEVVSTHTWEYVRSTAFLRSISSRIRNRVRQYGIKIDKVRLSECAKARPIRILHEGSATSE